NGGNVDIGIGQGNLRLLQSNSFSGGRYINTFAKLGTAGNVNVFIGQSTPDADGINGNAGLIVYTSQVPSDENSINLGSEQGNAGTFALTIVNGGQGLFGPNLVNSNTRPFTVRTSSQLGNGGRVLLTVGGSIDTAMEVFSGGQIGGDIAISA